MEQDIYNLQIFTMVDQQQVVYDLSNGTIFNDLEQPLASISRSRSFDAEYLRNCTRYIVSMEY